jgi:hypothetical protein
VRPWVFRTGVAVAMAGGALWFLYAVPCPQGGGPVYSCVSGVSGGTVAGLVAGGLELAGALVMIVGSLTSSSTAVHAATARLDKL